MPVNSVNFYKTNVDSTTQNNGTLMPLQKTQPAKSSSAKNAGLLVAGLTILATIGIYIATKGRGKKSGAALKDVVPAMPKAKPIVDNSENLLTDMKLYSEKIDSMLKQKIRFLEVSQPELKSGRLYEELKGIPFEDGIAPTFKDGKIQDNIEIGVRKYIRGDEEIARVNYYQGKPYKFSLFEKGQTVEEILDSGTVKIWNNADGQKTCAKYVDGKLEEYAVETPRSVYSVALYNSKIRNAKVRTLNPNGSYRKACKMDFDTDGELQRVYLMKFKPVSDTEFATSEVVQADFYGNEVVRATRTKFDHIEHKQISNEVYKRDTAK